MSERARRRRVFLEAKLGVQNQSPLSVLDNVGARDTVVLYNSQEGDK